MSPHIESVKHGYVIRRMWICENACGATHLLWARADACEALYARRRQRAAVSTDDPGRGSSSTVTRSPSRA